MISINIIKELALILVVCLAGEWVAALLPFAFPASVVSMILLLVLLMTGAVKQRQIRTVSNFFVVNMGLFFIPSLVGTLDYAAVLKNSILPFLAITFLTTPVVYLVTAWSVQLLMKALNQKEGTGHD